MVLSSRDARTVDPVRLGICRGGTYGLFAAPEPIVAPARRLGAAVVRINLFWSQLEPAPGRYDWTALDTFLDQLHGDVQAWITVAGSSTWASRISTPFLPPSPANDRIAYAAFVRLLVSRAAGRVSYWQCEIEPCVPLMWSATAQDYLGQLHVFSEAVRAVDTTATVVLGGAVPLAMVADAPGSNRQAADDLREIVHGASGLYDVFDLHPYGDPYAIPSLVAAARSLMAEAGTVRPVVAGEYAGPMPTGYPQNLPRLAPVLAGFRRIFADADLRGGGIGPDADDPELIKLCRDADRLPDTVRMFLPGCPPELTVERDRAVSSELIIRTGLLAACGVRVLAPYQLAPERPGESPYTLRALMFGAFALHDHPAGSDDPADWIDHPRPVAAAFSRLADRVNGADQVRLIDKGDPDLFLLEIDRPGTTVAGYVGWRRDGRPTELDLPIPATMTVEAVDALGRPVPVRRQQHRLWLPLRDTPVLVGPTADTTSTRTQPFASAAA